MGLSAKAKVILSAEAVDAWSPTTHVALADLTGAVTTHVAYAVDAWVVVPTPAYAEIVGDVPINTVKVQALKTKPKAIKAA